MELNNSIYYSKASTNYSKLFTLSKQGEIPDILRKDIYRPINPPRPFNSHLIDIEKMYQKKNALLINDENLKDTFLKFNEERRKNIYEKKNQHYFFDRFKDEEKNYNLAIDAILKQQFNKLPTLLSREKEKEKRNLQLKIKNLRNKNKIKNKLMYNKLSFNKLSLNTDNNISSQLTNNSFAKSITTETGNLTNDKIYYSEKNPKNKDFLTNNRTRSLDYKAKILKKIKPNDELSFYNKMRLNITNVNIKKPLSFSITNMNSTKLGKISIFGVFECNGYYGKKIGNILVNYFVKYFENSKEMVVCLDKNNYYSVLHWAFVNAQKYLIDNEKKFNIDLSYSGCMGSILLVPKNNKNTFYCANSGKCKCLLYTNRGIDDSMSFISGIDRVSERDRIFEFYKFQKLKKLEKDSNFKKTEGNLNINTLEIKKDKLGKTITEKNNDNYIKEEITLSEEDERLIKEKYFRYFKELGITRCFGNTSGAEMGLVPDPEVTECDVKENRVKFAVLGNTLFWRLIDEKAVRDVVSRQIYSNDIAVANKEIENLVKQKVSINSKAYEECSYVVVLFDAII